MTQFVCCLLFVYCHRSYMTITAGTVNFHISGELGPNWSYQIIRSYQHDTICLLLVACVLHRSYMTITAGTVNCHISGELGPGWISLWRTMGYNLSGDGTLSTQSIHLEHANCFSAKLLGEATLNLFGWYGMWLHLMDVLELVYLSASVHQHGLISDPQRLETVLLSYQPAS